MTKFRVYSYKTGETLFTGNFKTIKECIEQAVLERVCLDYADLRGLNLINANLDDGQFCYADFSESNLSGANLSEANLYGARFNNCTLYNTCLAYSNLQLCNFEQASFGSTDIHGSNLSYAAFSTLSCFTLNFVSAQAMKGCSFKDLDGRLTTMSHPPIVINGLHHAPIILIDRQIKLGHKTIEHKSGLALLDNILRTKGGKRHA